MTGKGFSGLLDRAISVVNPQAGLRRAAARNALRFLDSGYGNYGASTTKKSMLGWNYLGGGSKEDIEDHVDTLRQRSRDAYMGVPVATAALKTMRTNVVAGGLIPAPSIDAEYLKLTDEQIEALQAQIVREFDLWADTPTCDADRMDNFYQLQQLAFLNYLMNGDAIALLPMKQRAGQPYQLCIRLIEADRICSPDFQDRLFPMEINGTKVQSIIQGVETGEDGEVLAYWICNRHPLASLANQNGALRWDRVEAHGKTGRRNVLHMMVRERAGQLRGVPLLAPVLEAIKQLGRYTDAEIMAAVISAMFTVFIEPAGPTDSRPTGEIVRDGERVDDQDQTTIEMATGAIIDLNPGEKVEFADPKHPNTGYDVFVHAMIKQIGAALEIPPEVLLKQFTTTYSAARGALNEFWRTCSMQRDWFVSDFCQPIYEEWFAEAVARGRIRAPGFFSDPAIRKAYTGCVWNGPARTNLNPVQEVTAAEKRVAAGFSTAQEETAQMTGGDYTRNIRQRTIEARQKREVDEIINPPQRAVERTGGNNNA